MAEDGTTKRLWGQSWPHRRGSGDEQESGSGSVRVKVESDKDFDKEWVAFTRKAEDMVSFFLSFVCSLVRRGRIIVMDASVLIWFWLSLVVSRIIRWINSLRPLLL